MEGSDDLSKGGSGGERKEEEVGVAVSQAQSEEVLRMVAEMEARVRERAEKVRSQTSELEELEARLEAADRRRKELEAKGIRA